MYLLPLLSTESIVKAASFAGLILSVDTEKDESLKTCHKVPPFTVAVYPGLTFKGVSAQAARAKLLQISKVQALFEHEDCLRRLCHLAQRGLLRYTGMNYPEQRRWCDYSYSGQSQPTHVKPPPQCTIKSSWVDYKDVCTVCHMKSTKEAEKMEGSTGLQFLKCIYCKTGPVFHHGHCCPRNPQNHWLYDWANGEPVWPHSSKDDETQRLKDHHYAQKKKHHKGYTWDPSKCVICQEQRPNDGYSLARVWCEDCGRKVVHHPECCPRKKSWSQQHWKTTHGGGQDPGDGHGDKDKTTDDGWIVTGNNKQDASGSSSSTGASPPSSAPPGSQPRDKKRKLDPSRPSRWITMNGKTVKNPSYPDDQESETEDEYASEDEVADCSGNGDDESKGDADDRGDKVVTLLPNNTERVLQQAKDALMAAAPEVFVHAWTTLQRTGVEFPQEVLDMNINMLKEHPDMYVLAYVSSPNAKEWRQQGGVLAENFLSAWYDRNTVRRAQEDSTTASSGGEAQAQGAQLVARTPARGAWDPEDYSTRPFPEEPNLRWDQGKYPPADPQQAEPLKVILEHGDWEPVKVGNALEVWHRPIDSWNMNSSMLVGGQRTRMTFNECMQRKFMCEFCHTGYPDGRCVAHFMDKDLKVPLQMKQTIALMQQAEGVIQSLTAMEQRDIIQKCEKVYTVCFYCAGRIKMGDRAAYCGKDPSKPNHQFLKWVRSGQVQTNPALTQKQMETKLKIAKERLVKAMKNKGQQEIEKRKAIYVNLQKLKTSELSVATVAVDWMSVFCQADDFQCGMLYGSPVGHTPEARTALLSEERNMLALAQRFGIHRDQVMDHLERHDIWFYPLDAAHWYLIQPVGQVTPMSINSIQPHYTRGQALAIARQAIGTQWRCPIGNTKYMSNMFHMHRLVVISVNQEQQILQMGKITDLTETKITMTKVILMYHRIMDEFHGEPVTLDLMFRAIRSLNQGFKNAVAKMKEIGTYYSFDTSKVGLCAGGSYATHRLIRQHDCLSLCHAGSPISALVIDQKNAPFLGDAEVQSLLLGMLAFYDADLDKLYNMTQHELKMQYRTQAHQLEFGPKTCAKWYSFLDEARNVKNKLAGSPNWIHLPMDYQDEKTGLASIPIPVFEPPDIPSITGMEETIVGNSPDGNNSFPDPWSTGQDPWS